MKKLHAVVIQSYIIVKKEIIVFFLNFSKKITIPLFHSDTLVSQYHG